MIKPSGPSDLSLSQFQYNEVTRSISTPLWMGCYSIAGLPPAISSRERLVPPGVERHCVSKVSCPRTHHNVPGQGSNPDHSTRTNYGATAPPAKIKVTHFSQELCLKNN